MTTIYIALGSNEGNSERLIQEALYELSCLGKDFRTSQLYSTKPVNCKGDAFVNAVCSFDTKLSLEEFIPLLEAIEKKLGKTPKGKDEARLIDLDILFYGSEEYAIFGYTVPHLAWQERSFVLEPLSELAHEIVIGHNTFNIKDLCKKLS